MFLQPVTEGDKGRKVHESWYSSPEHVFSEPQWGVTCHVGSHHPTQV